MPIELRARRWLFRLALTCLMRRLGVGVLAAPRFEGRRARRQMVTRCATRDGSAMRRASVIERLRTPQRKAVGVAPSPSLGRTGCIHAKWGGTGGHPADPSHPAGRAAIEAQSHLAGATSPPALSVPAGELCPCYCGGVR